MEEKVTFNDTPAQGSPLSADTSHSSGYSTDLAITSKTVEESNEKLIEEAINSPPKVFEPTMKTESSGNFDALRFGIPSATSPEVASSDESTESTSPLAPCVSTSSPVIETSIQTKSMGEKLEVIDQTHEVRSFFVV